ncbi:bifunctional folylpolyglutamate synthase/dihydrofolate synthase [Oceanobacillus manasiensis]|uniref:bifunctional folylpolyglutamate synthase/dihydrofolate synthase n=1 Tax=Oceanobacillus manasiensis TaxID=586413 RepID=UPI0005A674E3|nr:cyanophycin synthetase [Oceanobacillus manasiensis]
MFTTFDQVINFIESRKSYGIKPGLDRIKTLLHLSDEPQKSMKAIHIAGTNGKGSTSQYIRDALIANGYNVGLFCSPSPNLTGHIWNQEGPITEREFLIELNRLYSSIKKLDQQGMHPTEFEIITALAFLYFSQHSDIAVIEAGMGGREDTTNCFEPLLSIITNVAMDHTGFLGDHLKDIAYHKAGIIKSDVPVITGELKPDANHVIVNEVDLRQTALYQLGSDFTIHTASIENGVQNLEWKDGTDYSQKLKLQMKGSQQAENAALAIKAISLLIREGYAIEMPRALNAISHTTVPGRFELVNEWPNVILDGAHNPDGINSFLSSVLNYYPNKERHLLFGVFKDKDMETMLDLLSPHFTSITLTTFDHPRAAEKNDLQVYLNRDRSLQYAHWHNAVKFMNETNQVYFITGSLHFIMQVRNFFEIKS